MSASLKLTWTPQRPSARLKQSSLPQPLPGSYFLTFISPTTVATHFYLVNLRNSALPALSDVHACCQTLRDGLASAVPLGHPAPTLCLRLHQMGVICDQEHVSGSTFHQAWVSIGGKRTSSALSFPALKLSWSADSHREEPFFCSSCGEAAGSSRFWGAEIQGFMLLHNSLAKAKTLLHVKFAEADLLACRVFAYACDLQRLHRGHRWSINTAAISSEARTAGQTHSFIYSSNTWLQWLCCSHHSQMPANCQGTNTYLPALIKISLNQLAL